MHKTKATSCKSPFPSPDYDLYSVLEKQKALLNTFQATTLEVEESSRIFQDCANPEKVLSGHWGQVD